MLIVDAERARQALPFPALLQALAAMFRQPCEVPQRHVHHPGEALTTLLMPAWTSGRYLGVKIVNIGRDNAKRGLPGLHSTYQLFDAESGVPLALIDGNEITSRRTAAASALAAAKLARADAQRLLVVGCGRVGGLLAEAYRAAMPIRQVRVWDQRPEAARALALSLRAQGMDAEAADELPTAVRAADIVSCATLATEPLIRGDWLSPGSHLDLIGSFTPEMREADDACFRDAALWVDTREALIKSGELLAPLANGALSLDQLQGDLAAICRGETRRSKAEQRSIFKSVGTALADLAAAVLVYEQLHGS